MQKLKSPIDKAYFNILKLRIFQKTKQLKEEKELLTQLIKDFHETDEIMSDEPLMNYFKEFLRNNDEEKAAQDLLSIQLKKKDLNYFLCLLLRRFGKQYEGNILAFVSNIHRFHPCYIYNKCLPPKESYYYFPKGEEIMTYNSKKPIKSIRRIFYNTKY